MSDHLDEAHAQAGLTLLTANLPGRVHDGKVPDGTDPNAGYVLVYAHTAWPREGLGNSVREDKVTATTTLVCHCVGATASAARTVGGLVRFSLLNMIPVVAGRSCGPVREDDVLSPNRDETTGALVMDQVRTYSYISVPAA